MRCACAINEYASRLGVQIRAGLHTGECEILKDRQVGGLAVEIGAQIRGRAASGEVLVSSTVKDLVAGSGIRFINHGLHTLDGIAGDWQLFKVERQESEGMKDEG